MGRSTPCSMTMRTYVMFGMSSIASAIHYTKVNNKSVGDTVRNNTEAECANHSLIRSGSLCGSNYSHVAVISFIFFAFIV